MGYGRCVITSASGCRLRGIEHNNASAQSKAVPELAARTGWPLCAGTAYLLARAGNPGWQVAAIGDKEGITAILTNHIHWKGEKYE